jgi:hypothetical protein
MSRLGKSMFVWFAVVDTLAAGKQARMLSYNTNSNNSSE